LLETGLVAKTISTYIAEVL